jgi:hypothetical protein
MLPSSCTPEGQPTICPICGAWVTIEPSFPLEDAPCPCCGHLLVLDDLATSFASLRDRARSYLIPAAEESNSLSPPRWLSAVKRAQAEAASPLAVLARRFQGAWLICIVLVAAWIWAFDGSFLTALAWEVVMVRYVFCIPRIFAWIEDAERNHEGNWRGFLQLFVGFWGLTLGPLIGCSIGALVAPFTGEGWAVWQGACLGLVCGSLLSMLVMAIVLPIVFALAMWHLRHVMDELPHLTWHDLHDEA